MDDQPELPYGGAPPSVAHSATSIKAGDSIEKDIGRLQKVVLETLRKSRFGETDESISEITGLALNTVRPRRRELELMGKVKDSGETRKTHSGRSAVIWKVS